MYNVYAVYNKQGLSLHLLVDLVNYYMIYSSLNTNKNSIDSILLLVLVFFFRMEKEGTRAILVFDVNIIFMTCLRVDPAAMLTLIEYQAIWIFQVGIQVVSKYRDVLLVFRIYNL